MHWAVIFDMDGVIIDSEPFHWIVNKRIFIELGVDISESEYQQYIGTSNTNMWTSLKKQYRLSQEVSDLVVMQVNGNIAYMETEEIPQVRGVVQLIGELSSNKIPLAIASSSPYRIIDMVVSGFNIRNNFSAIVSGEDFEHGKPAPDIFLKASQLLGVPPEKCVVIEDSTHGVTAAHAAGMRCVGLNNKNSGNQNLNGADMIINGFSELSIQKLQQLATCHKNE